MPPRMRHPVIASADFVMKRRWLLGRPPSRTMTAESHRNSGGFAMSRAFTRPTVLALAALLGLAAPARADDPFYKGKRLTLLINFAAGGPTDIEGRLFAKYLVKQLDGQAGGIVEHME